MAGIILATTCSRRNAPEFYGIEMSNIAQRDCIKSCMVVLVERRRRAQAVCLSVVQ